jgi:hypothetical protein
MRRQKLGDRYMELVGARHCVLAQIFEHVEVMEMGLAIDEGASSTQEK